MAKTATEPAGTSGSQFFVVTGDGRRPAARVRRRRRGDGRARRRRADRHARRPGDRAAAPAGRRRVGHRVALSRVAAVVLAAGAATRFGSPKQRLLLPRVLERLAASPVDEIVVVEGAYELRGESPRANARLVRCPEWERGPGASLRCGLAALGDGRRGGGRRPRRRARGSRPRRSARVVDELARRRRHVVAASYGGVRGHPLLVARAAWATSRTRASASSSRGSSRATTSATRATSTRPPTWRRTTGPRPKIGRWGGSGRAGTSRR